MPQQKQREWTEQWSRFADDSLFLFREWIYPNTLEDFRGKRVLDAGCGRGQHIRMTAPYAREVVGADLNTAEIVREQTENLANVQILEADIASLEAPPFEVVYCIGVIHHTDDPNRTFENLKRLTARGGRLILWAYSREGNFLNRTLLEWAKGAGLRYLPTGALQALSYLLTLLLYPIVWTLYVLPLARPLPFYEYFGNFRKLSFRRNMLNVFDKLNAPQTHFISRSQVASWFNDMEFQDAHISHYKGVSWRCSGTKR